MFYDKLPQLINKNFVYVGDIGIHWIQYVPFLIDTIPDCRIICLKRNKQDTVNSWLNRNWSSNFLVAKGSKHWNYKDFNINVGNAVFPRYDLPSDKAVSQYWDDYYEQAAGLQKQYPDNFLIVSIEKLNKSSDVKSILDFIGIRKEHRRTQMSIKTNRRNQLNIRIQTISFDQFIEAPRRCNYCIRPAQNLMTSSAGYAAYICDPCVVNGVMAIQQLSGISNYLLNDERYDYAPHELAEIERRLKLAS
jgi:hypothetical protein